jgi:hypothetical protein
MAALLMPMIAILAAIIAYWQWKTARNKLRFDLFDRRFAVYDAARNLLGSIITTGVQQDLLFRFEVGTREAKWLFNDEIDRYFKNQLGNNAYILKELVSVLDSLPDAEERSRNINRQSELKQWFGAQYNVLDRYFEPFLKLKH